MNKEIKEILEIFKQVDLEQEVGGCYNCPKKDKDKTCIGCLNNAKDKLLDYIINLEEENNELLDKVRDRDKLIVENTQLKRDRIDKAIEYVENNICGGTISNGNELLKLLKGEENDNSSNNI